MLIASFIHPFLVITQMIYYDIIDKMEEIMLPNWSKVSATMNNNDKYVNWAFLSSWCKISSHIINRIWWIGKASTPNIEAVTVTYRYLFYNYRKLWVTGLVLYIYRIVLIYFHHYMLITASVNSNFIWYYNPLMCKCNIK